MNTHPPLRLLLALLPLLAMAVPSQAAEKPRAVVELFTSQGCSSCPAADKILAAYAREGDILALSWHVDYWNYLGWKDTFSSAEATQRQYDYAKSFHRRGVYTPQAVVNGRNHAVGSKRQAIDALIAKYKRGGTGLPVELVVKRGTDDIRFTANSDGREANLVIVYFDRERNVAIARGENAGKTVTYHNVVRNHAMIGMTKSGVVDVTLPIAELKRSHAEACAILLQQTLDGGLPGPIIAAAVVDDL